MMKFLIILLILSCFSYDVNAIRKLKRSAATTGEGDNFLGEIKAVPYSFVPAGWALCDGSLLQISQYQALYALIGTTFGGNGATTFALPDLRGRSIIGAGQGSGLTNMAVGAKGGVESFTPAAHTHTVSFGTHSHTFSGASTIVHNHTVAAHSHTVAQSTATVTSSSTAPVTSVVKSLAPSVATSSVSGSTDQVTQTVSVSGTTTAAGAVSSQATSSYAPTAQSVRDPYLALKWIIATQGIWPSQY